MNFSCLLSFFVIVSLAFKFISENTKTVLIKTELTWLYFSLEISFSSAYYFSVNILVLYFNIGETKGPKYMIFTFYFCINFLACFLFYLLDGDIYSSIFKSTCYHYELSRPTTRYLNDYT